MWEETKPWISPAGLYRGGKQSGWILCTEVEAGERYGREREGMAKIAVTLAQLCVTV